MRWDRSPGSQSAATSASAPANPPGFAHTGTGKSRLEKAERHRGCGGTRQQRQVHPQERRLGGLKRQVGKRAEQACPWGG